MKIIIVGDGKVGLAITAQLSREGHDLTVIDSNSDVLKNSIELYDVMVIHGNGAALSTLKRAEAENADLLIAATSGDEINLMTCLLAKKMGTKNTIARVRNPEYDEQLAFMREELGLSMMINPELSAATEIYHSLQFPSFLKRDSFAKGRVEIVECKISEDSPLCGIPLNQLYKILSVKVLICAVVRKGEAFIPGGDFVIMQDDRIHVTADSKDLARVIHDFELKTHKVKNVLIIGGSHIAYHLTHMLLSSGIDVKIIERNYERSVELATLLPDAVIINGDGNDQRLLLEEGICETDAIVTLTNMDEENIFLSLYGSHVGVQKTVTKVNQTEYTSVVEEMGIDSAVSPKALCAIQVARYVRAMANKTGGTVLTMHEIVDGAVHALEFRANAKTKHLDLTLQEAPIKKGVLIACIFRNGKTIIPEGQHKIKKGDSVIVITPSELTLIDLNDIFEE